MGNRAINNHDDIKFLEPINCLQSGTLPAMHEICGSSFNSYVSKSHDDLITPSGPFLGDIEVRVNNHLQSDSPPDIDKNVVMANNSDELISAAVQLQLSPDIGKPIDSNTEATKSSDENDLESGTVSSEITKFKKCQDNINKEIDLQRKILVERKILSPSEAKKAPKAKVLKLFRINSTI